MPNSFITVKEIARQALPRLIDNLVMPNLIHKDYSEDFVSGKGAKIQVRKPVKLVASDFSGSVSAQDVNEESVEVTLDKLATVDVAFGAIESATNVDDLNRLFIEPAAAALAEKINKDGLELYKDIPSFVKGDTASTYDLTTLANSRLALNKNKAPVSPRRAIWSPSADADFTKVSAIVNAEKSGSTAALRDGSIGKVFGLENYMSQAVKTHASGATATGLKVTSSVSAGATTLSVTGTSLTGKFVKGDILNITGAGQFVVTEDTSAADTNVIATVKVFPALPALTANTTITLEGAGDANLAFHPNAFAFVTRPLTIPSGVEAYVTSYNGVTLRVVKGYDMTTKKEMLSMDVLYGYKTMYEDLAVRVGK